MVCYEKILIPYKNSRVARGVNKAKKGTSEADQGGVVEDVDADQGAFRRHRGFVEVENLRTSSDSWRIP